MDDACKRPLKEIGKRISFNDKYVEGPILESRLCLLKAQEIIVFSQPNTILNVNFEDVGKITIYPEKGKVYYVDSKDYPEGSTKLPTNGGAHKGNFDISAGGLWDEEEKFNHFWFYQNPLE